MLACINAMNEVLPEIEPEPGSYRETLVDVVTSVVPQTLEVSPTSLVVGAAVFVAVAVAMWMLARRAARIPTLPPEPDTQAPPRSAITLTAADAHNDDRDAATEDGESSRAA